MQHVCHFSITYKNMSRSLAMISLLLTYLQRDIQREASVRSRRKAPVTWKRLFSQSLSEKGTIQEVPRDMKAGPPFNQRRNIAWPFSSGSSECGLIFLQQSGLTQFSPYLHTKSSPCLEICQTTSGCASQGCRTRLLQQPLPVFHMCPRLPVLATLPLPNRF